MVSMQRFFSLICRGWYLYSCSVGMLVRGPIFRLIIASVAGLQAAAIFDIAIRISQTIRDVIATGFSVLYPSFSSLYRNGKSAKIVELIQISLYVLLPIGGLLLGLLVGAVNPLFRLWLGDYPVLLPAVTQILAIWQVVTLLNVPFWYLLQATHNEYRAAWSIWTHTVAIILLLPLSLFIEIGVVGLMNYWVFSSILTQGLIYFSVHTKLKLLWVSINCSKLLYSIALVIIFLSLTYWISFGNLNLIEVVAYLTLAGLIYSIASISIVYRTVHEYIRR